CSISSSVLIRILCLFFFLWLCSLPLSTLFPYTTLFRSLLAVIDSDFIANSVDCLFGLSATYFGIIYQVVLLGTFLIALVLAFSRSEEHTSELQSRFDLVCRLLLEKKKKKMKNIRNRIKI